MKFVFFIILTWANFTLGLNKNIGWKEYFIKYFQPGVPMSDLDDLIIFSKEYYCGKNERWVDQLYGCDGVESKFEKGWRKRMSWSASDINHIGPW